MVDVVSLMAGRYLEGGGGEVATWPQLNQREGGEKAPLLVSTTLARRARVEMFATFYGSGKVSFSDQSHSFYESATRPPSLSCFFVSAHPSHVREC